MTKLCYSFQSCKENLLSSQIRNCLALLLAADFLEMLPRDREPVVQGWFMQSGVDQFNFCPFSGVWCLVCQSVGAWYPGACPVNCIVQSCAFCFVRRGRGGGTGVLHIHLQEISCWSGRIECEDLDLQTPVQFSFLLSSLYAVMVLVTLKPTVSAFKKIYASLSSYAIQLVLDVNDTYLLVWPWISSDSSVCWQQQGFIWHRNCLVWGGECVTHSVDIIPG